MRITYVFHDVSTPMPPAAVSDRLTACCAGSTRPTTQPPRVQRRNLSSSQVDWASGAGACALALVKYPC